MTGERVDLTQAENVFWALAKEQRLALYDEFETDTNHDPSAMLGTIHMLRAQVAALAVVADAARAWTVAFNGDSGCSIEDLLTNADMAKPLFEAVAALDAARGDG